jgi:hypothetical protein
MKKQKTQTMYVVLHSTTRRYLTTPITSGEGEKWGRIGDSQLFSDRDAAQRIATAINLRRPAGSGAEAIAIPGVRTLG